VRICHPFLDHKIGFLLKVFRPLGYEPTRALARLFCSITDVLLVAWFFLLFG